MFVALFLSQPRTLQTWCLKLSEHHEHHGGPDLFEMFEAAVDSEKESNMDVDYVAGDSDFDPSNPGDLDHAGSSRSDKLLTVTKLKKSTTRRSLNEVMEAIHGTYYTQADDYSFGDFPVRNSGC